MKILNQIEHNVFRFKVHCSAGTYIRTLFSDIAKRLGTISTTTVIIRNKSGLFDIENAITLKELESAKEVYSIEDVFSGLKIINISDEILKKKLLNGVKLSKDEFGFDLDENFFIKIEDGLIGMYHFEKQKLICDVFLCE